MAASKTFSDDKSPTIPGAVMEWQSGPGRTFRFAVTEDGLIVGSAPGADIRLGQKDPPLLASFRLCSGKSGEENQLHYRILAPHCPLLVNGQPGEMQSNLKARDRIEIAGYVGLVIQIQGTPLGTLSERIGAPELVEYAKALEAHAALVDQWHKSLEKRQEDLEKRELEMKQVLQEVIQRSETRTETKSTEVPGEIHSNVAPFATQIPQEQPNEFIPDKNTDKKSPSLIDSEPETPSNWDDEGDSWDFLTHPEIELAAAQLETSAQYWPPAEEAEFSGETSPPIDPIALPEPEATPSFIAIDAEAIPYCPDFAPLIGVLPEKSIEANLAVAAEITPYRQEINSPLLPGQDELDKNHQVEEDQLEEERNRVAFPPQSILNTIPLGDPFELEERAFPNLSATAVEPLSEIKTNEFHKTIEEISGENHQKPITQSLNDESLDPEDSCLMQSPPESWTVPLGEYLCSNDLDGDGPIEAIHISGSPKVFVEAISQEDPVGGHTPWEHENLPRELERQQGNERDFRVWEIPQGPGLMALELPPVLGIWYRLFLQTVLGIRALHSAGRSLGGRSQQQGQDWAALEPSGLVKLYGPGNRGNNQTDDLQRVGHLAQNLWNKAFGQNAPQPEFIKDLLGRLIGQDGTYPPMESLDQLAVELDRVGLRIRANPYAWAALLQKTFPGWTSPPTKRVSA